MPLAWAGALVRGRSWWRTTLAGLAALVAVAALVGIAVEADTASSGIRYLRATDLTALPVSMGGAPPSWVTAEPHRQRTAELAVAVRGFADRFSESWTYRLSMAPDDPLLGRIRTNSVNMSEVLAYVLGTPWGQVLDFGPPTIEQPAGARTAVVVFSGRRDSSFETPGLAVFTVVSLPMDQQGRAVGTQLVDALTIQVTGTDAEIVAAQGKVPSDQRATSVRYIGPPEEVWLTVHSTVVPPAQDQGSGSDTPTASPLTRLDLGWLYFPVVELFPWVLLLLGARRSALPAGRLFRESAAIIVAIALVSDALVLLSRFYAGEVAGGLLFGILTFAVPMVALWWARHRLPDYSPPRFAAWLGAVVAVALALAVLAVSGSGRAGGNLWSAVAVLVLGATAAVAVGLWSGRLRAAIVAGLGGAGLGTAVLGAHASGLLVGLPLAAVRWLVVGVCWTPLTLILMDTLTGNPPRRRRVRRIGAVIVSAVLLISVADVVLAPDRLAYTAGDYPLSQYTYWIATEGIVAANLALALVLVALLLAQGRRPEWLADPLARTGAIVLAVLLAIPIDAGTVPAMVAVFVAALAFTWLLPSGRVGRAVRLSRVSRRAHRRLVAAESWRRLMLAAGAAHYRTARKDVAENPTAAGSHRTSQDDLDRAVRGRAAGSSSVSLAEAALGSSGGLDARANGLAAAFIGTVLAAPMIAYEIFLFLHNTQYATDVWTVDWLDFLRMALRWPGYALIFGYFYPLVRGTSPIAKATALLGAMLLPEAAEFLGYLRPTRLGVLALLALAGQLAAFCLGLGLYWEMRQVRSAGLLWSRIRDLRSLRTVATPLTTVLVAVGTAAATAVVGAAAGIYFKPDTGTAPARPDQSPSATASQTPGPRPTQ